MKLNYKSNGIFIALFLSTVIALPAISSDNLQKPDQPHAVKAKSIINKVNINTATANQLSKLKGIGKQKAKRIIEFRLTHGEFKSIEELRNVKGIGSSVIKQISPAITI